MYHRIDVIVVVKKDFEQAHGLLPFFASVQLIFLNNEFGKKNFKGHLRHIFQNRKSKKNKFLKRFFFRYVSRVFQDFGNFPRKKITNFN